MSRFYLVQAFYVDEERKPVLKHYVERTPKALLELIEKVTADASTGTNLEITINEGVD